MREKAAIAPFGDGDHRETPGIAQAPGRGTDGRIEIEAAQLLHPQVGEQRKLASVGLGARGVGAGGSRGGGRSQGRDRIACPAVAVEMGIGAFPGPRVGAKAAGKWRHRRRLHAGHGQERSQVGHAISAVAALVDAQAPQPPLVCPGADRVGMNAEQPRSTHHGQVDGFGSGFDDLLPPEELVRPGCPRA